MLGGLKVLFQSILSSELSVTGNAKCHVGYEKDSSRDKENCGVLSEYGDVQSIALCLAILRKECSYNHFIFPRKYSELSSV